MTYENIGIVDLSAIENEIEQTKKKEVTTSNGQTKRDTRLANMPLKTVLQLLLDIIKTNTTN